MAILETKALVEEGIANAYASAGNKGATIPAQKNIKNLAGTIESIQSGGGIDSVQTVTDYPATEVKNTLYVLSSTPAEPYDAVEMRYNKEVIWEKEHFTPTEGLVYTYRADTDDYMVGDGTTTSHNGYPLSYTGSVDINIPEYYDDGEHGRKRVTEIGQYALSDLKINKLNAPWIKKINTYGCTCPTYSGYYIRKPYIPNCTYLGTRAFFSTFSVYNESALADFDFSNIEYFGSQCFYGAYIVGTLNFGKNVSYISPFAFSGAKLSDNGITLDAGNTNYKMIDNCIYTIDGSTAVVMDYQGKTSFIFPDGCTTYAEIGNIYNYDNLTYIDFNNINKFEAYNNFLNNLTKVRINANITSGLNTAVWTNCKEFIIGSNVSDIAQLVYMPSNSYIKYKNLEKFTIESGNTNFAIDNNVNIYSKDYTKLYYFHTQNKEWNVRSSLVEIAKHACLYNTFITSITLPASIKTIGVSSTSELFTGYTACLSFTILGTDYALYGIPPSITEFNGSSTILDLGNCIKCRFVMQYLSLDFKQNITKIILPKEWDENYNDLKFNENCVLEYKYQNPEVFLQGDFYNFQKQKTLSGYPNSGYFAQYDGRILFNSYGEYNELFRVAGSSAETLELLDLPTNINRIRNAYSNKSYMMNVNKIIVNSKLERVGGYLFDYVNNIVRFNTTSEQLPVISTSANLSTSSTYKVHIPFDDISAWWNTTNISNWRGKFVGYKTYATGDTFPTTIVLANTTYNLTWYSDEALTTEAGATATADSEYYCTLQQA